MNRLETIIERIVQEINPEKIILFGSRAKDNNYYESDYDLCVLKQDVNNKRKLAQLLYRKLYGLGIAVDLIVQAPDKFEELESNPYMIYNEIALSGKVIYEKS